MMIICCEMCNRRFIRLILCLWRILSSVRWNAASQTRSGRSTVARCTVQHVGVRVWGPGAVSVQCSISQPVRERIHLLWLTAASDNLESRHSLPIITLSLIHCPSSSELQVSQSASQSTRFNSADTLPSLSCHFFRRLETVTFGPLVVLISRVLWMIF
jgi:hypothetical protein